MDTTMNVEQQRAEATQKKEAEKVNAKDDPTGVSPVNTAQEKEKIQDANRRMADSIARMKEAFGTVPISVDDQRPDMTGVGDLQSDKAADLAYYAANLDKFTGMKKEDMSHDQQQFLETMQTTLKALYCNGNSPWIQKDVLESAQQNALAIAQDIDPPKPGEKVDPLLVESLTQKLVGVLTRNVSNGIRLNTDFGTDLFHRQTSENGDRTEGFTADTNSNVMNQTVAGHRMLQEVLDIMGPVLTSVGRRQNEELLAKKQNIALATQQVASRLVPEMNMQKTAREEKAKQDLVKQTQNAQFRIALAAFKNKN